MRLRPYCQADFDQVIKLWWISWHSSSGYKHHRPIADWKQRWLQLESNHKIVVVEHQGAVIAFAALNSKDSLLSQLFVSPQWKRKGIGTQLMNWVSTQCPNGFSLKTADNNQESIDFYKKFGLVETGESINDFNGRREVEYTLKSGLMTNSLDAKRQSDAAVELVPYDVR